MSLKLVANCFKPEPFPDACGCDVPYIVRYPPLLPVVLLFLSPLLSFPTRLSQLVHVGHDHGGAYGCCIASFDQDITDEGV